MNARRAALAAGGVMLVAYLGTMAPSVTFWDAGEFIAAARVLGIPHPPGTPLFVVLLNVWARVFSFLPFAVATNLFSAVCTAASVALTAWFVARSLAAPWLGLAAITAGAMTSVWQNATETEVYAASLLLSIAMLVAADVAGRTRDRRWLVLVAYLIALSVPLHLSALVASPAAIYLAARGEDGEIYWAGALALSGVAVAALGVSRMSAGWCALAALLFLVAAFAPSRDNGYSTARVSAMSALVTVLAFSGVVFLLLRARHDPPINQGNATTWSQLGAVLSRRQYAVAGVWPRQAPVWLQLANWFEYADWQFALSLGPSVVPTVARVVATLGFASLGVVGMRWHRRAERRSWTALAVLFASGSLGVLAYLNLKAGSSFAWQLVTSDAGHEARDRDYFFVLGFWTWGVWAGLGAFRLVERLRLPRLVGVFVGALPLALNWSAVSRRVEPEASLPTEVASALLDSLPRNAMLFVAGDNDTYPLWYAQQVEHRRNDVTMVTLPLLGAPWYVEELERRNAIKVPANLQAKGEAARLLSIARAVATRTAARGRPIAIAMTVPASDRRQLFDSWTVIGAAAIADNTQSTDSKGVRVDTARVQRAATVLESWRRGRSVHPSTDPVHEYFLHALSCPSLMLNPATKAPPTVSLDSTCNLR